MNINKETVNHVAAVARLNLTEKEIQDFVPQLNEVLDAFSKLNEVDTSNIEPAFQPVLLKNQLREDSVMESLPQKEALANSNNNMDGYFKGPSAV